jgi:putative N6-adenine-specific DNA methylase
MDKQEASFKMVAKTFAGLEKVLAEEIRELGGKEIKTVQRAVEFTGDDALMYRTNYQCRSAIRILKPIAEFYAPNENVLYDEVKKIAWDNYLDISNTFSVDGHVSYSHITHSKYLALKSKDAIADQFREHTGKRPSVDKFNPDLRINVRIFKNFCTVSIDGSGESLHRRGYRKSTGPAPLNEVLAAGMILLTGWKGDTNFIDPMCGSGTLAIEAAMISKNMPAGMFRESWAFQGWKDFDSGLWEQVTSEAKSRIGPLSIKVVASDRSGRILQVARENIEAAGLTNDIEVKVDFIGDVVPPPGGGLMVTNPPYGERIKSDDINKLYADIGDNLKQQFVGYNAWIISSHMEATKHIGLRPAAHMPLNNGALACKYLGFEIYEGSKKDKQEPAEKTKQNKVQFRRNREGRKPHEKRKRI